MKKELLKLNFSSFFFLKKLNNTSTFAAGVRIYRF